MAAITDFFGFIYNAIKKDLLALIGYFKDVHNDGDVDWLTLVMCIVCLSIGMIAFIMFPRIAIVVSFVMWRLYDRMNNNSDEDEE